MGAPILYTAERAAVRAALGVVHARPELVAFLLGKLDALRGAGYDDMDELNALEDWREDLADQWSVVRFGNASATERLEGLRVVDAVIRLARAELAGGST